MLVFGLLILASTFSSVDSWARSEHDLIRRVAVFPVKAPSDLSEISEKLWWDLRGLLTSDQRFLVASKNFLLQKDVFQPRSVLKPADAIILGKVLDAHALITIALEDKALTLRAYDGVYGRELWINEIQLQPSVPVSKQIEPLSRKLVQGFLASFPYQGFVYLDPLKGSAVFREGSSLNLIADVGLESKIEIGDQIQVIRLMSDSLKPLFSEDALIEVIAEGRVLAITKNLIQVDLDRTIDPKLIKEGALIRIPKELKRLKESYGITESMKASVDPQFLSPRLMELKKEEREKRPLVTSLTFIANLAAFLLLAF